MLLSGTKLSGTARPVDEPAPNPPAAEAVSAEVLFSTGAVAFGTAAAQGVRRETVGGRLVAAVRRWFATSPREAQPRPHHYPQHYGFLEQALLAREMERL